MKTAAIERSGKTEKRAELIRKAVRVRQHGGRQSGRPSSVGGGWLSSGRERRIAGYFLRNLAA